MQPWWVLRLSQYWTPVPPPKMPVVQPSKTRVSTILSGSPPLVVVQFLDSTCLDMVGCGLGTLQFSSETSIKPSSKEMASPFGLGWKLILRKEPRIVRRGSDGTAPPTPPMSHGTNHARPNAWSSLSSQKVEE